jgi:hypothetical protein
MGPLLRLSIFLSQLVRNPPGRRKAAVMLVALLLAIGIVVVEKMGAWPESWKVDRAPVMRMR